VNGPAAVSTPWVAVAGVGLWASGYPGLGVWRRRAPQADAVRPAATSLKPMDRRRASLLGRAVADASAEALAVAGVDPGQVHFVVGSSIAEAATLIGMLEQTWRRHEPISPAAFTMSVHNAASGLLSISHGNRGFVTSLAADEDTPAAALLEGIGLVLTSDRPVLVVCGDEASPVHLVPADEAWELLAAGVVLRPVDHPGPVLARLRLERPGRPGLPAPGFPEALARNPQSALADLVDAVDRHAWGLLALGRDDGQGYGARIESGSET